MSPEQKQSMTRAGWGLVAIGAVCQVAGFVIAGNVEDEIIRRSISWLAGMGGAIFIFGCTLLARSKGRPWYYGLLGLLSWVGLLILWFAVGDRDKVAS